MFKEKMMTSRYATTTPKINLANWTKVTRRSALQEMLVIASCPGMISFALGLPAAELFPTDACGEAAARVLKSDPRALQYGPPFQPLKTHITRLMAERGVECKESQIFLTAGAQQGMSLLTRLLLEPGGQVLYEEMSYTGFQQVVEPFQPRVLTVPTDLESGADVEAIARLLARGERPAFIYAVTDGHNPLAVSLSAEKRVRMVELARQYCVPIIEDDAYGFLHYEDARLRPMRALDDEWVLYVGSFSKILAPAFRVGWLVVPEWLIPKLSIIKESSDIDMAPFSQRNIAAYIDSGGLSDHLATLRREYSIRRDTMLGALEEHFSRKARWRKPDSGVFIWVEFSEGVDTERLLRRTIEQEQVAFVPGHAFSSLGNRDAANCMRLNFSNSAPDRIKEGIARLARVFNSDW